MRRVCASRTPNKLRACAWAQAVRGYRRGAGPRLFFVKPTWRPPTPPTQFQHPPKIELKTVQTGRPQPHDPPATSASSSLLLWARAARHASGNMQAPAQCGLTLPVSRVSVKAVGLHRASDCDAAPILCLGYLGAPRAETKGAQRRPRWSIWPCRLPLLPRTQSTPRAGPSTCRTSVPGSQRHLSQPPRPCYLGLRPPTSLTAQGRTKINLGTRPIAPRQHGPCLPLHPRTERITPRPPDRLAADLFPTRPLPLLSFSTTDSRLPRLGLLRQRRASNSE